MKYVWNVSGICEECAWNLHGIGLAYVWNMSGICMEYAWNMHGSLWEEAGGGLTLPITLPITLPEPSRNLRDTSGTQLFRNAPFEQIHCF